MVLKSLDSSGVKVAPAGGGEERLVPLDQFLEVQRSLPPAPTSGKFVLHLTGGDKIGGEPLALKAESLVWKSPSLGEVSIPTNQLAGLTQPDKPAPAERTHEDVVGLSNGDTVHGIIASMSADKITVQTTGGGNSDIPLSSVATVSFAATPGASAAVHGFRVRLDDGSSIVGSDVKLNGDALMLTLGKETRRKLPQAHVSAIEQLNGPVSWLSSRTPSEAVYLPFIGPQQQPAAYMDRSWLGQGPIEFKARHFARGIGVHAYSRLSWTLDGNFAAFRTRYAIDGDDAPDADVTVRILLDDKPVYEQQHVRAGVLSPVTFRDLGSAKKLTLEVDGTTAYAQDRLNWIEPALLKNKPVAAATEESSQ